MGETIARFAILTWEPIHIQDLMRVGAHWIFFQLVRGSVKSLKNLKGSYHNYDLHLTTEVKIARNLREKTFCAYWDCFVPINRRKSVAQGYLSINPRPLDQKTATLQQLTLKNFNFLSRVNCLPKRLKLSITLTNFANKPRIYSSFHWRQAGVCSNCS